MARATQRLQKQKWWIGIYGVDVGEYGPCAATHVTGE